MCISDMTGLLYTALALLLPKRFQQLPGDLGLPLVAGNQCNSPTKQHDAAHVQAESTKRAVSRWLASRHLFLVHFDATAA